MSPLLRLYEQRLGDSQYEYLGSQNVLLWLLPVEVEVTLRPTISRPVSLGVRRPSGNRGQFYFRPEMFFRQLRVCNLVAPSPTRGRVCNLLVQLLLGLARVVTLGSKSRRTHDHISLSHLRLPNLEGHVPVFISPRNRVAQLYPWALGSLYVASYDSQGSSGGILTRPHTAILPVNISWILYH
jgi:hypothetical protein